MKNLSVSTLLASAFLLTMSLPTSAAVPTAPGQNKLLCFSGTTDGDQGGITYGGVCTLTSKGAKGPATLDNTGGDPDGSYSGVYVDNSNLNGKLLADANRLSFHYAGIPTNGSPRISLPLDTNGDGVTDVYAFISAFWCNNAAGLVDAINNPNCQIFVGSIITPFVGWAAFVAAYPTATMGPDGALPFIIADDTGPMALWTVYNVTLGKPGK